LLHVRSTVAFPRSITSLQFGHFMGCHLCYKVVLGNANFGEVALRGAERGRRTASRTAVLPGKLIGI
jgi:hypothetical protein